MVSVFGLLQCAWPKATMATVTTAMVKSELTAMIQISFFI